MSNWTKNELDKIAAADEIHISPFCDEGVTYGTSTCIWSVVIGDSLYVRGYNGHASYGSLRGLFQRAICIGASAASVLCGSQL
jgi:hypothetical protein